MAGIFEDWPELTTEKLHEILKKLNANAPGWKATHDSVCYKKEDEWIQDIYYKDFINAVSMMMECCKDDVQEDLDCPFPCYTVVFNGMKFGTMHGQGTLFFVEKLN